MSKTSTAGPSANWRNLQKTLVPSKSKDEHIRKKRKLGANTNDEPAAKVIVRASKITENSAPIGGSSGNNESKDENDMKNGESLSTLRRMVAGELTYTEAQKLPGKYLAIDCEMVGVGIDGTESSLARVTVVNFYGAVQMDEFVRQRERVVDYRTQYSGIRETDMIKAKPFDTVQKQVADLLKDKILVGHAVHNDLKALLLSHPRPLTRDTQYFAGKHKVVRSKYVALRNLVKQELDITIQGGEHSSLQDARATMAVYRIHRKEWEKGTVAAATAMLLKNTAKKSTDSSAQDDAISPKSKGKRKSNADGEESESESSSEDDEEEEEDVRSSRRQDNKKPSKAPKVVQASKRASKPHKAAKSYPGGGRKGVSSGLSTIVRNGRRVKVGDSRDGGGRTIGKNSERSEQWWKAL
ncbi:3'-5' exonuclease [Marasmius sp. AFHP31]|nr:3'-5' exonuclease [Marasmius sp. AFHP31]